MKKTWDRGKKRLTPAEKIEAQNWQRTRVKIINMITRKPEIQKICCICGKEGKTLHNRKDPYFITFICDECKKDPNNLIIAEESRFDIRDRIDKAGTSVNNYSDEQIIRIITSYMNSIMSLGEFCEQENISRYQFNQVLDRYQKLCPSHNIRQLTHNHFRRIQKERAKQIADQKKLMK